jgi:cob(I)alamin adenosyltransferase
MVKIDKIYTRTGDAGETHLVGGQRVKKSSVRVAAYGELDELNSYLGMIRTVLLQGSHQEDLSLLALIQNDLFDIGSIIATPHGQTFAGMAQITPEHVKKLEDAIDRVTEHLPELRSFVLPGGSDLNSWFHIARTVCRRVERSLWVLHEQEPIESQLITYINRLSDLLFALARLYAHKANAEEFLWVQQKK